MDGQNTVAAYGNLIDRLRAIRRQWRWLTFSEGLLKCIGILALVMTGTVIVLAMSFQLWQFAFSRWIRIAIVLLSIGGAVYAVIRSFVLPLCNRLTDAAIASRLESTQTGKSSPLKIGFLVLSSFGRLWRITDLGMPQNSLSM